MIGRTRGFDDFLGPADRLIILDPRAEKPRLACDGGGQIQIFVVNSPAERGT
jgi:hypothetical protein